MNQSYQEFILSKSREFRPSGIPASEVTPHWGMIGHHSYQAAVLRWALTLGRSAAFLGTGLGKTLIELCWADHVARYTGKPVLIFAPLAVAQQIVRESAQWGIACKYASDQGGASGTVSVTNYDRLHLFDISLFGGVVLDESSIVKSVDGATRTALIGSCRGVPFKLAATATPAPNDHTELGNHAEFLGVMTRSEMLAMYFAHDGGSTQDWRLKGHARKAFWRWVASWAVCMAKPSDGGFDDAAFDLPPLTVEHIEVAVHTASEGMLFALPAETLGERIAARRDTARERVEKTAQIISASPETPWLIWCSLNSEQDALERFYGVQCYSVRGSMPPEEKEAAILGWLNGQRPVMISKTSLIGFGLNFQHCHNMAFVGVTDSFEAYYQAVRRCWRFGQNKPVRVIVTSASTEGNVIANLKRKEKEALNMGKEMREAMLELNRDNLKGLQREASSYARRESSGDGWNAMLGDCVDLSRELADDSIDYSVFSPPFSSLYTYSSSDRDMGNCIDHEQFWLHYRFLIEETIRVMRPGRLVSVHCMNLPTSKVRDGHIGIVDFRGDVIRAYQEAGFIYHSEVCIWKDPVTAMQRTKALGLLHKQIKKDSAMSRQGIADYLVTFRKPGENLKPIAHTADDFPVSMWQRYASPVWMDIDQSDTLQHRSAREYDDERHLCPLQLEVIRRAIKLWSAPGDLVWSPFMGIASEGYVALEQGRRFLGFELKESYFKQAAANLSSATATKSLFAMEAI